MSFRTDSTATAVVICDDHRLFTDSLAVALSARGYRIVARAYDLPGVVTAVRHEQVDVCLVDYHFPDAEGTEGVAEIRAVSPDTVIIMLSASTDPAIPLRAIAAGACAFARKDQGIDHVVSVIESARLGTKAPSSEAVVAPVRRTASDPTRFLTSRELEVLSRLVQGQDTSWIAREMGVTYATARTHIQNLITKLGVHSKLQAVAFAITNGLIPPTAG